MVRRLRDDLSEEATLLLGANRQRVKAHDPKREQTTCPPPGCEHGSASVALHWEIQALTLGIRFTHQQKSS